MFKKHREKNDFHNHDEICAFLFKYPKFIARTFCIKKTMKPKQIANIYVYRIQLSLVRCLCEVNMVQSIVLFKITRFSGFYSFWNHFTKKKKRKEQILRNSLKNFFVSNLNQFGFLSIFNAKKHGTCVSREARNFNNSSILSRIYVIWCMIYSVCSCDFCNLFAIHMPARFAWIIKSSPTLARTIILLQPQLYFGVASVVSFSCESMNLLLVRTLSETIITRNVTY